ncbi:hypothetical protein TTHERM_00100090 (macronuclear) [Tetrahymena thermophila SB210]|uniref:Uncharacterized protein n=1 Tax=Tetrahymena thermophila (strain SB210) TaxID=312017 RepID=Q234U1_TETTS|nr:hypothetical protein TTHERM_00100090 [Tetrahymena thermophila SB210]EAR91912.1 hypothetical protein TTHERM_00100090 [Tetrahymena thermophila SB210]|eukprot:XP_001012157.1 hypothetical protein TTHERM_00100090 [Tetrahymena thermophila SB210]
MNKKDSLITQYSMNVELNQKKLQNNENQADLSSVQKKIRKRKNKNNDHLLVRKKEYQLKPIMMCMPQQYQYHLFNDIVIDFDLIRDAQSEQSFNRGLLWHSFKSISQVNILNDGSMMEWIQENLNQPILSANSMIYMLQSISSQTAYRLAADLNIVNDYRNLLTRYLCQMNPQQRIDLFQKRREFSVQKSHQYVKNISRNSISIFYEYLYNDKQQTHEYRRMGFSKKLLSLVGIDIKDAPGILLRRGFIDICSKQLQALYILKRNVLPQFSRTMPEITEFQVEGEHHTLEGIPFKCKMHVRVYNTTHQYDHQYCLELPIKPDTLTEISIEVPEEELRKIYEIRHNMNILTKYSLDDFVNGEFQYLVQVENFLEKYYSSPYSYRKSNRTKNIQNDSTMSQHVIINSNEHNTILDNDSSCSIENIVENQQNQSNNSNSLQFFDSKNPTQKNIQKSMIHPSIKDIKLQQNPNYLEAYCPDREKIYSSEINFATVDNFINEYKYNQYESRMFSSEILNLGSY